jgi:hypothetical protein
MKNTTNIVAGIIACVLISVFLYVSVKKSNEAPIPVNDIPLSGHTESSILGCYVAKLAKDVYTLQILTEEHGAVTGRLALNNYEKDSSSGTFKGKYENDLLFGHYDFTSEGVDSVMQVVFKKVGSNFVRGYGPIQTAGDTVSFDDVSHVTYDPQSTFVKSPDCLETFTEMNDKFTFEHSALFGAYEASDSNTLTVDWRANTTSKGMLLASVTIPRTFMPETNFSNARFTVGVSTDPRQIKSCMTQATHGETKEGEVTIAGYPFTKFTLADAATGNRYDTTSYRGILDGDCYVIEYTIHSTNMENYSPDQGITEFDKSAVVNELEKMVESFRFLVNAS